MVGIFLMHSTGFPFFEENYICRETKSLHQELFESKK
jgi:hypothetical protein